MYRHFNELYDRGFRSFDVKKKQQFVTKQSQPSMLTKGEPCASTFV